jgi:PadR family transcriptional regulator PadR
MVDSHSMEPDKRAARVVMTFQVRTVLALLADGAERYGREVMEGAALESGTAYPLLRRLAAAGWVEARREVLDESLAGRRARLYYRLTEAGHRVALAVSTEARRLLFRAAPQGTGRRGGGG